MFIPYESIVWIAASGGAIIIFFIIVAVFCICRHVRRSHKAVIHILSSASANAEDVDQPVSDAFCERNQLITTAKFLHSFNPKATIHAIIPSQNASCTQLIHTSNTEQSPSNTTVPVCTAVNSKTPAKENCLAAMKHESEVKHLQRTKTSVIPSEPDYSVASASKDDFRKTVCQPDTSYGARPFHGASSTSSLFSEGNIYNALSKPNSVRHSRSFDCKNGDLSLMPQGQKPCISNSACSNSSKLSTNAHNLPVMKNPDRTLKIPSSLNEPSSSMSSNSRPRQTLQKHHSFNTSKTTPRTRPERRRLLRAQSFQEDRTRISVHLQHRRSQRETVQPRRPRRRTDVSLSSPNESQTELLRPRQTQPHLPNVICSVQRNSYRTDQILETQRLEDPNSTNNQSTRLRSIEDVVVLDGSEPPPPYHS